MEPKKRLSSCVYRHVALVTESLTFQHARFINWLEGAKAHDR